MIWKLLFKLCGKLVQDQMHQILSALAEFKSRYHITFWITFYRDTVYNTVSVFCRSSFIPCNCLLHHCIWWRRPPWWNMSFCIRNFWVLHSNFHLASANNVVNAKKSQCMTARHAANFSTFFAAGVDNNRSRPDILCCTVTHTHTKTK